MRRLLASFSAADWLSLSAAPVFALMALLTALTGDTQPSLCTQSTGWLHLSGMVPMYLLMAAFHLAPWLKLAATNRS